MNPLAKQRLPPFKTTKSNWARIKISPNSTNIDLKWMTESTQTPQNPTTWSAYEATKNDWLKLSYQNLTTVGQEYRRKAERFMRCAKNYETTTKATTFDWMWLNLTKISLKCYHIMFKYDRHWSGKIILNQKGATSQSRSDRRRLTRIPQHCLKSRHWEISGSHPVKLVKCFFFSRGQQEFLIF